MNAQYWSLNKSSPKSNARTITPIILRKNQWSREESVNSRIQFQIPDNSTIMIYFQPLILNAIVCWFFNLLKSVTILLDICVKSHGRLQLILFLMWKIVLRHWMVQFELTLVEFGAGQGSYWERQTGTWGVHPSFCVHWTKFFYLFFFVGSITCDATPFLTLFYFHFFC